MSSTYTRRDGLKVMGLGAATAGIAAVTGGVATPTPLAAQTPSQGAMKPDTYRFGLGDFQISTITETTVALDGPHPIFGEDQPPEAVADLAEKRFLPADQMVISFTPVVVNTGSQLVLFDAGNGPEGGFAQGDLPAKLQAMGLSAEQIDVVVITHFHPDHIGGLTLSGFEQFPNARYVASEAEYNFWASEEKLSGPTERVARLTQEKVVPLAEKMTFIKDEGEVVPGIRGLAAFGHTPGHMVFHVESGSRRLLITADAANHYVMSLERPDWHVRFDMDKEAAAATRKKLFGMIAADKIPFSGYHMPFPSVGFVEPIEQTGFRYVPASYQFDL